MNKKKTIKHFSKNHENKQVSRESTDHQRGKEPLRISHPEMTMTQDFLFSFSINMKYFLYVSLQNVFGGGVGG